MIDPEATYQVGELSTLLPTRPTRRTLERWLKRGTAKQGILPSRLIGGRRCVDGSALLAWLRRGEEATPMQLSRSPAQQRKAVAKALATLETKWKVL